jgi:integrase
LELFFRVLASTGLRVSEGIALQWRHLQLEGSTPHVKVRRPLVKGTMGAPKSRHSRRDVPLDPDLVLALREQRRDSEWPGDDDLAFPVGNGSPIMPNNLRRRVLKPTAEEAGVPWVGFHMFRHTCASLLLLRAGTPCRCRGGSVTTRRRSRSALTSTCSTVIWGSQLSLSVAPMREEGPTSPELVIAA